MQPSGTERLGLPDCAGTSSGDDDLPKQSAMTADDEIRVELDRLAVHRERMLAIFRDKTGTTFAQPGRLDLLTDWWSPPTLVGDAYFNLDEERGPFGRAGTPFVVKVRERAKLIVEDVHAEVFAHDRSEVAVHGSGAIVSARKHAQVDAEQQARVWAFDQAEIRAIDATEIVASGRARIQAEGFSQIVALGHSFVIADGWCRVRAGEDAIVKIGRQVPLGPALPNFAPGWLCCAAVEALGPVMIKVEADSAPCAIALQHDKAMLMVTGAGMSHEWWQETWRLSERFIDSLARRHGDPLERLRRVRLRHDPQFAAEETAANWKLGRPPRRLRGSGTSNMANLKRRPR